MTCAECFLTNLWLIISKLWTAGSFTAITLLAGTQAVLWWFSNSCRTLYFTTFDLVVFDPNYCSPSSKIIYMLYLYPLCRFLLCKLNWITSRYFFFFFFFPQHTLSITTVYLWRKSLATWGSNLLISVFSSVGWSSIAMTCFFFLSLTVFLSLLSNNAITWKHQSIVTTRLSLTFFVNGVRRALIRFVYSLTLV